MAIEIHIIKGEACPVIVCDVTGEIITDASMANAVWSERSGADRCTVLFVKKGKEPRRSRRVNTSWYALPEFLYWLGKNSGYREQEGSRAAQSRQCNGEIG